MNTPANTKADGSIGSRVQFEPHPSQIASIKTSDADTLVDTAHSKVQSHFSMSTDTDSAVLRIQIRERSLRKAGDISVLVFEEHIATALRETSSNYGEWVDLDSEGELQFLVRLDETPASVAGVETQVAKATDDTVSDSDSGHPPEKLTDSKKSGTVAEIANLDSSSRGPATTTDNRSELCDEAQQIVESLRQSISDVQEEARLRIDELVQTAQQSIEKLDNEASRVAGATIIHQVGNESAGLNSEALGKISGLREQFRGSIADDVMTDLTALERLHDGLIAGQEIQTRSLLSEFNAALASVEGVRVEHDVANRFVDLLRRITQSLDAALIYDGFPVSISALHDGRKFARIAIREVNSEGKRRGRTAGKLPKFHAKPSKIVHQD